jgi:hypothetical protein
MSHPNRRKSARATVDFFVEEHRDGRSWLHPAIDLSVDGVYVLVSDDRRVVDPDVGVEISFTLPTGAVVRTAARIAYVDDRLGQRGLGLAFADLADAARDAIEHFVDAALDGSRHAPEA